jgi:hypothetical protein
MSVRRQEITRQWCHPKMQNVNFPHTVVDGGPVAAPRVLHDRGGDCPQPGGLAADGIRHGQTVR